MYRVEIGKVGKNNTLARASNNSQWITEVVVMYRVEIGKVGKLTLFLSYHSHAKLQKQYPVSTSPCLNSTRYITATRS
jgi:hypothetical protein